MFEKAPDDPIESIVSKLKNIETGIEKLSRHLESEKSEQSNFIQGREILSAAHQGAVLGASKTVGQLHIEAASIHKSVTTLDAVIKPTRLVVAGLLRMGRLEKAMIILLFLFSVSVAFIIGVSSTRSGLTLTTEIGCRYLGGQWTPRGDTGGHVCWR